MAVRTPRSSSAAGANAARYLPRSALSPSRARRAVTWSRFSRHWAVSTEWRRAYSADPGQVVGGHRVQEFPGLLAVGAAHGGGGIQAGHRRGGELGVQADVVAGYGLVKRIQETDARRPVGTPRAVAGGRTISLSAAAAAWCTSGSAHPFPRTGSSAAVRRARTSANRLPASAIAAADTAARSVLALFSSAESASSTGTALAADLSAPARIADPACRASWEIPQPADGRCRAVPMPPRPGRHRRRRLRGTGRGEAQRRPWRRRPVPCGRRLRADGVQFLLQPRELAVQPGRVVTVVAIAAAHRTVQQAARLHHGAALRPRVSVSFSVTSLGVFHADLHAVVAGCSAR